MKIGESNLLLVMFWVLGFGFFIYFFYFLSRELDSTEIISEREKPELSHRRQPLGSCFGFGELGIYKVIGRCSDFVIL